MLHIKPLKLCIIMPHVSIMSGIIVYAADPSSVNFHIIFNSACIQNVLFYHSWTKICLQLNLCMKSYDSDETYLAERFA